jgi:hypothetical protein
MIDDRMHEFHPGGPNHTDQSVHGRRKAGGAVAVAERPTPAAAPRKRAPKAATAEKKTAPPAAPAEPKTPRKRAPKAAAGAKPTLAEVTGKPKASNRNTVAAAQKIYGGMFGGLNAKVNEATITYGNSMVIAGDITNAEGHRVGTFTRTIAKTSDGEPYAVHGSLYLSPKVHGQGFAEAFNANAIQWYRDNDVKSIHLFAAGDVGGYAWARAGYDWGNKSAPEGVLKRIRAASEPSDMGISVDGNSIPEDRLEDQRQLARDLLDRFETAEFGTVEYPTPYEVSQLGRWPGAGKDDMWIGKAIMLGSSWKGVRYL